MNVKELFRKKTKPITAADIHKDFKTISEAILVATETSMVEPKAPEKPELLKRYERLGLTGNKHVQDFKDAIHEYWDKEEAYDESKNLIKIIDDYRVRYPLNAFIPHQTLLDLCEKYGLVFERAQYFTEDIPMECLEAMENFKLRPEDSGPGAVTSGIDYGIGPAANPNVNYSTRMDPFTGIENIHRTYNARDAVDAMRHAMDNLARSTEALRNTNGPDNDFRIVATKDMFKLPANRIWDKSKHTSVVDDPLVLIEVKHGWLLVTAWGPEAELPEINLNKQ